MELWTNLGLGVNAILMIAGWWTARRRGPRAMTLAPAAPVAVLAAFAAAEVVKKLVGEVRPCRSMPRACFVDTCPAPSDYALPGGHATVAAFAVLEGSSRVYVGTHYPHDVLASAVLALPVALLVGSALCRWAAPLVGSLSHGALRPLLAAEPTATAGPARQAASAGGAVECGISAECEISNDSRTSTTSCRGRTYRGSAIGAGCPEEYPYSSHRKDPVP
ncbi:hypothetical protein [Streptomyces sp. NPDC048282]|uniref:phosphatase PAP2 family protein n=1 Tax=Streptomyces sp. NPDC048282 TaxID=3365528 RepID=UPI00371FCE43